MIKTIIFDLGNVIVSFDHGRIAERLAALCGRASDVIFAKAVERANYRAEEGLFIDDAAANVEGAWRFGMQALQFVSAGQLEADLKELLDLR